MKNIDKELVTWAIEKIEMKYKDDVALLIGQVGSGKIPTDEQNMVFDFFIPATDRGYQLAKTFMIEEMGYDLYPISWERLEGIANIAEPRMIFAFAKGEVIYARTEEDRRRYEQMKNQMYARLNDNSVTFAKGLEFLETAQEIFQTMLFEISFCKLRKAAGGVCCYLMNALAMLNGTYLEFGYMNLTKDLARMQKTPKGFLETFQNMLASNTLEDIQRSVYDMIRMTRELYLENKKEEPKVVHDMNYEDLALWYHEARYTFRRIEYYTRIRSAEDSYLLGCYLQIEFDAICDDFALKELDLMGAFDAKDLSSFAIRAKEIEEYLVDLLRRNNVTGDMYASFEEFAAKN